jgi:hypothetical protein
VDTRSKIHPTIKINGLEFRFIVVVTLRYKEIFARKNFCTGILDLWQFMDSLGLNSEWFITN